MDVTRGRRRGTTDMREAVAQHALAGLADILRRISAFAMDGVGATTDPLGPVTSA
jgi:hypothetical protein